MKIAWRRFAQGSAASLVALMGSAAAVAADDLPPGGWSFSFTTYSWLSWLTGDISVAGRAFDVDVDPIEVIDHLDWSTIPVWMSYAEARNGKLFLFNDIVYAKLEGSGDFARSKRGRLGLAALSLGGDVESDVTQVTIEAGGGYEVARWNADGVGSTSLDLLAGARYWHQETDISADVNLTLDLAGLIISRGRAIAKSGSVDWVDPFIGARLRHQLAPGEEIVVRGDIGGFGAGSDFSWQAIATYNWQLCTVAGFEIDGYVGYRALAVDYSQGSGLREYEYDVLQHGPVLGMTTRF